jgi:ParB-like chromosome segregation protein Spo0J
MRDLPARVIDYRSIATLRPAKRNARTHSRKQIRQIANSIERFGFTNPVLVDEDGAIIAGHGRVAAAKLLGITQIPVVPLGDLSPKERQAYALDVDARDVPRIRAIDVIDATVVHGDDAPVDIDAFHTEVMDLVR